MPVNISVKPNRVGVTSALVYTLISFRLARHLYSLGTLHKLLDTIVDRDSHCVLRNEVLV